MSASCISLSLSAAKRIHSIALSKGKPVILRLSVEGGGCTGFRYDFSLVESVEAEDMVVEREGARLVVDPVSLEFVRDSEVDYVESMIGSAFSVRNPNARSSCGCGVSFSV